MQGPRGAMTGHSNLWQLNGYWKDTIWEPRSGCQRPRSSALGRKPWLTADRESHDEQSGGNAGRRKTENALERISIWISQQGCCFVRGCHTQDFCYTNGPRWMWKVLWNRNVKPEIAATRETEKEEWMLFLCNGNPAFRWHLASLFRILL